MASSLKILNTMNLRNASPHFFKQLHFSLAEDFKKKGKKSLNKAY